MAVACSRGVAEKYIRALSIVSRDPDRVNPEVEFDTHYQE